MCFSPCSRLVVYRARQARRARREVKRFKTYLGRVCRDIVRKLGNQPDPALTHELALADRLLTQQRKDKNKLYSLHAPEVECIAKGKAHKKFEIGVKVSVASTNKDNFVVGIRAEPGNPYDGHTLCRAIDQVQRITGCTIKRCFVDRGYRGHGLAEPQVLISGRRRDLTPQMKKELKRRSAIEPVIGHMKADGKLGRNCLLGRLGDAINALLCGAGHNIRLILNKLRERLFLFLAQLLLSLLPRIDRMTSTGISARLPPKPAAGFTATSWLAAKSCRIAGCAA